MTDDIKPEWVPKPAGGPDSERPPYIDRNLAAMKIGSRSPRVYGKVAEGIAADLLEAAPHLAEYPEELAALASTEAVVALLRVDIAARGLRNPDGSLRAALLDRYFTAERTAAKRRDAIGVSPLGEAVIARERASAAAYASSAAVDLDALARRGRQALDAREAQPVDLVIRVLEEERTAYATEREIAATRWKAAKSSTEETNDQEGN